MKIISRFKIVLKAYGYCSNDSEQILRAYMIKTVRRNGVLTTLFSLMIFLSNYNALIADSLNKNALLLKEGQYLAPDIKRILDQNVLRVSINNANVPPFFMKGQTGNLIGVDVSLARDLAKELNVNVQFVKANSFDEVVRFVYEGRADVGISKLSVTLGRAEQVRYTGQYVTLSKALLVNRFLLKKIAPNENISLEEAFSQPSATIAVIANSSYVGFAERIFPKAKVIGYQSWNAIIKDVLDGKILAAFRDEWEINQVINSIPDAPLKARAIRIKGEEDPIKIIVPWGSGQLSRFIEEYIKVKNIQYDVSTLSKIYKKYIETREFTSPNQTELE